MLLTLGIAIWLWRSGRRNLPGSTRRPDATPSNAQAMIPCALCQVHVPEREALAGTRGRYCCAAHRQQAEG